MSSSSDIPIWSLIAESYQTNPQANNKQITGVGKGPFQGHSPMRTIPCGAYVVSCVGIQNLRPQMNFGSSSPQKAGDFWHPQLLCLGTEAKVHNPGGHHNNEMMQKQEENQ